jgi:hypothetical protein
LRKFIRVRLSRLILVEEDSPPSSGFLRYSAVLLVAPLVSFTTRVIIIALEPASAGYRN